MFDGGFLGAQQSIDEAVFLSLDTSVSLEKLYTSEGCIAGARSGSVVDALEQLVGVWCQQIELVLAEGSQMRREADDTGPLAELEYWKRRTAKFSCLVDQIKSKPCRGVITTLVAAKSKTIKVTDRTGLNCENHSSQVGYGLCTFSGTSMHAMYMYM